MRIVRLLAVASLLALSIAGFGKPSPAGAVACTTNPRLAGSFLQPSLGDSWTAAQWTTELNDMKASCLSQIILQWTADSKNKTAVYPSGLAGYTQNSATDVVGKMLTAADAAGID